MRFIKELAAFSIVASLAIGCGTNRSDNASSTMSKPQGSNASQAQQVAQNADFERQNTIDREYHFQGNFTDSSGAAIRFHFKTQGATSGGITVNYSKTVSEALTEEKSMTLWNSWMANCSLTEQGQDCTYSADVENVRLTISYDDSGENNLELLSMEWKGKSIDSDDISWEYQGTEPDAGCDMGSFLGC